MQTSSDPLPSDNKNAIGQRLKMEMKKRGISSVELAKRADVKTSFIYDVISGKSGNPSTVKLARVAESLDINLGSLVGNDGEPKSHLSTAMHSQDENYVAVSRITVDMSDGVGKVITEQKSEYYYFRKSWITEHLQTDAANLRMLHISGDSMEPTLLHNDIVLVDTSRKVPSPPGVFVLFDGMGITGKRLEYVADQKMVHIISDNPQYSTYERSIDDTFIIGRVVWFAREI
ncbi:MAG: XRE family transcriptional regulator [Rickettsiales bacterium]